MEEGFLTTFANAKINLALAVQAIRDDGYHEIQSVMQSIALYDIVRVRRHEGSLICRCGTLSGPENLAYKAALEFVEQCGVSSGIEIVIDKNIPVQAGLAGGSTDAAATLRLLNQLYGEPLGMDELIALGGKCGADVAFCLQGGTMWATGRGERLEILPTAPKMDLVLIKPTQGVNTGEAYRRFDLMGQAGGLNKTEWEQALEKGTGETIAKLLYNDLEPASVQLVPDIESYKKYLLDEGCYGALMSGSGSSVFGIAKGRLHAVHTAEALRKKGLDNVWVTTTV